MHIDGWIVLTVAVAVSATFAANLPLIVACHRHGVRNRAEFPLRLLLGQTPSQFLYLGLLFPVAALAATWAAVKFIQAEFPTQTFETTIIDNFWIILVVGIPISMYVVYCDVLETTPDFFLLRKDLAEKGAIAAECIYDAIETREMSGLLEEIRKIECLNNFEATGAGRPADVLCSAIVRVGEEAAKTDQRNRLSRWIEDFDQNAPELHKSILFLQSLFTQLLNHRNDNERNALIDPTMRLADKAELAVVVFFIWNYLVLFALLGLIKSDANGNAEALPVEVSLFVISATLLFWYVPLRYYTQRGMAFLSGSRAKEFGGAVWAALLGVFVLVVIVVWIDPDVGTVMFKILPIIVAVMGLLLTHFRFSIARNIIGSRVSIRQLGMFGIIYCAVLFFTGIAWFA